MLNQPTIRPSGLRALAATAFLMAAGCAGQGTIETCERKITDPEWAGRYNPDGEFDDNTMMDICTTAEIGGFPYQQCIDTPKWIRDLGNEQDYVCFPALD